MNNIQPKSSIHNLTVLKPDVENFIIYFNNKFVENTPQEKTNIAKDLHALSIYKYNINNNQTEVITDSEIRIYFEKKYVHITSDDMDILISSINNKNKTKFGLFNIYSTRMPHLILKIFKGLIGNNWNTVRKSPYNFSTRYEEFKKETIEEKKAIKKEIIDAFINYFKKSNESNKKKIISKFILPESLKKFYDNYSKMDDGMKTSTIKQLGERLYESLKIRKSIKNLIAKLKNKTPYAYGVKELIYDGKLQRKYNEVDRYLKLLDGKMYDANFHTECTHNPGSYKIPIAINGSSILFELKHEISYPFNEKLSSFIKKNKINNISIGLQISDNIYISKIAGNYNLLDFLVKKNKPIEINLFSPLLLTLKLFHQNYWVHRDLKPENIMIQMNQQDDTPNKLVIIDCDDIVKITTDDNIDIPTIIGTKVYTTAELLNSIASSIVDKRVDNLIYFMQAHDEYAMALVMLFALTPITKNFFNYIINESNYEYNGVNYQENRDASNYPDIHIYLQLYNNDKLITKFIENYIKKEYRAYFIQLITAPLDYAKTQYKNNKLLLERRVYLLDMINLEMIKKN
jgi:serine/threonine protein kinase